MMSNYEYTLLYCGILYRRIFQDLQNFRNIVLLLSRSLLRVFVQDVNSYCGYYFISSLKKSPSLHARKRSPNTCVYCVVSVT